MLFVSVSRFIDEFLTMETDQPMCSICLKRENESTSNVLLDITKREESSKSSLDKIQELMKVEIVLGYKTICSTCTKQVDEAYALREKILEAITFWRNHFELAAKNETDTMFDDTKEEKPEKDDDDDAYLSHFPVRDDDSEGDSQESKLAYTPPLDKKIKTENDDSFVTPKEIPGMVDLTEDKFEVISLKDDDTPPKIRTTHKIPQSFDRILDNEERIPLKSLRCGKCKYYFSNATEIIGHICTNDVQELIDEQQDRIKRSAKPVACYGCAKCGKLFMKKMELNRHKKAEHFDPKPLTCNICDKMFKNTTLLREHYSVHTGEHNYSCDVCNKTFQRMSSKSRHMRKHSSSSGSMKTPFLCTICGKIFPYSNTLSRHMQAHAGVKRFECKICQKMFNQTAHLRVHMRTHTGEKPYTCEYCAQSFSLNASLRKHIFNKHKEGFKSEPDQHEIKTGSEYSYNEDNDYEYE